MEQSLKDLKFTITQEMNDTIIEMLVIKQMLEKNDFSKREKKIVENYFHELKDYFTQELHSHNQLQIQIFRNIVKSHEK